MKHITVIDHVFSGLNDRREETARESAARLGVNLTSARSALSA